MLTTPSAHPVDRRHVPQPDTLRALVVPDELCHPAGGSRLPGIHGGLILDLQISETGDALPGTDGAQPAHDVRAVDFLAAVAAAPITDHCGKLPSWFSLSRTRARRRR